MSADLIPHKFIVSRETKSDLQIFADLVQKWSPKINLVAKSTIADVWTRHIIDSLETIVCVQRNRGTWVDLGSGGGFPGAVAAIVHKKERFGFKFVEADKRKSAFLRTVVRELKLNADVISERIESIGGLNADILTARALAPLPKLLSLSLRHIQPETQLVFPKGQQWEEEIVAARTCFDFDLEVQPSLTQEGTVNLVLRNLKRHE